MSSAPSMPMFWDAYLADTTHLSTEEHGAYLLLLGAMWRRNGSVPDNDRDNARILGLTAGKWRQVKARLAPLLIIENGQITQKNLQKIWKITQEKIAVNRMNGAKGGRPKTKENNDVEKPNGFVSVKPNETIPEPEPEPIDTVANATVGAASAPPPVISPEPKKSTGRVRGAARAAQIPPGWAPCPASYAYGSKQGLTPQEINHEADQFRNHAAQNRRTLIDWHAGFRTWLGKAGQWKRERSARPVAGAHSGGQSRGGGLVAAGLRAIRETRGYGEPLPDPVQGRSGNDDMGTGYDLDGDALRIAGGGQG